MSSFAKVVSIVSLLCGLALSTAAECNGAFCNAHAEEPDETSLVQVKRDVIQGIGRDTPNDTAKKHHHHRPTWQSQWGSYERYQQERRQDKKRDRRRQKELRNARKKLLTEKKRNHILTKKIKDKAEKIKDITEKKSALTEKIQDKAEKIKNMTETKRADQQQDREDERQDRRREEQIQREKKKTRQWKHRFRAKKKAAHGARHRAHHWKHKFLDEEEKEDREISENEEKHLYLEDHHHHHHSREPWIHEDLYVPPTTGKSLEDLKGEPITTAYDNNVEVERAKLAATLREGIVFDDHVRQQRLADRIATEAQIAKDHKAVDKALAADHAKVRAARAKRMAVRRAAEKLEEKARHDWLGSAIKKGQVEKMAMAGRWQGARDAVAEATSERRKVAQEEEHARIRRVRREREEAAKARLQARKNSINKITRLKAETDEDWAKVAAQKARAYEARGAAKAEFEKNLIEGEEAIKDRMLTEAAERAASPYMKAREANELRIADVDNLRWP